MLSDRLERYGEEQWATVERLAAAADGDGPLDLLDPFDTPEVRSPAGGLRVDWNGRGKVTATATHGVSAARSEANST